MDRGAADISGKYTTSGNDYKKPDDHANSSRRGRSRNGTVEWVNTPNIYTPRGKGFYNPSGACSSHYPPRRTVKTTQDFNALTTPEKITDIKKISDKYGASYDGRKHNQFAISIKEYTSASRRPLGRDQISQLIPLLQEFKPTQSWSWRSLTTTFHSFASAGVFNPNKHMNETVQNVQANLLSTLLDVIKLNCQQKPEPNDIDAQGTANLLWAVAKLMGNGLELEKTPKLKEAVAALLPHVKTKADSKEEKDHFNTQGTTNLLWAMAKLVGNGLELKEAVAALLPHVKTKADSKEEKDHFNTQHIANLLWAVAKLGEGIELSVVEPMFDSVVYISENHEFSQQSAFMSLWAVMAYCARLPLSSNTTKNNRLEKHIENLFTRLVTTSPDNEDNQSIIAMAALWLGRECPVVPHYQTTISHSQSDFRNQLKSRIPSLKIEEEKSLNGLPPVDLLLPGHGIVIEVQGPSHYVGSDFKTRSGSTLLKVALLQKLGYEVIEIPVNELGNHRFMDKVIAKIKAKSSIPPEARGSVSLKSGGGE